MILLYMALMVWPMWRICSRAGFPGWYSIGVTAPCLYYLLILYLAGAQWPALRRPSDEGGANPDGRKPE
jgi:hypothetical protein